MSHIEVKTWRFRCDECGATKLISAPFFERPKGWSQGQLHDCGLTGYTKDIDLCPKCTKKKDKK